MPPAMNQPKAHSNRERILAAADQLFYERGFNRTSFTDVAAASGIPKGNFYYYFKSKNDLLEAVIQQRMDHFGALLAEWTRAYPEPKARLKRFAQVLLNEAENVIRYGCPMGTLNAELGKSEGEQRAQAAELFTQLLEWLVPQFEALGAGSEARSQAMHLLAMTQGASLLTHVYSDTGFLTAEVQRIEAWIDAL